MNHCTPFHVWLDEGTENERLVKKKNSNNCVSMEDYKCRRQTLSKWEVKRVAA